MTWWRMKLGFRGDEEFVTLASLAEDRRTYLAAVGLIVSIFDAAHKQDTPSPRGTIVASDGGLVALLQEAGLLSEDGSLTEQTWNKYRLAFHLGTRGRDESGRFVRPDGPNVDHAGSTLAPRLEKRELGERSYDNRTDESLDSTTEQPERIGDALARAPWNNRGKRR